jgi:hypothetical protein
MVSWKNLTWLTKELISALDLLIETMTDCFGDSKQNNRDRDRERVMVCVCVCMCVCVCVCVYM